MRLKRRSFGSSWLAESALAGLLACLVLILATLSFSHTLHRALHPDGSVDGHLCLVCTFAKGQVSAPEVGLICAAPVLAWLWGIFRVSPAPFAVSGLRLPSSRAPPPP